MNALKQAEALQVEAARVTAGWNPEVDGMPVNEAIIGDIGGSAYSFASYHDVRDAFVEIKEAYKPHFSHAALFHNALQGHIALIDYIEEGALEDASKIPTHEAVGRLYGIRLPALADWPIEAQTIKVEQMSAAEGIPYEPAALDEYMERYVPNSPQEREACINEALEYALNHSEHSGYAGEQGIEEEPRQQPANLITKIVSQDTSWVGAATIDDEGNFLNIFNIHPKFLLPAPEQQATVIHERGHADERLIYQALIESGLLPRIWGQMSLFNRGTYQSETYAIAKEILYPDPRQVERTILSEMVKYKAYEIAQSSEGPEAAADYAIARLHFSKPESLHEIIVKSVTSLIEKTYFPIYLPAILAVEHLRWLPEARQRQALKNLSHNPVSAQQIQRRQF